MSDVIVEIAKPEDFEKVTTFYDEVIAVNHGSEFDVLWNRSVHPSDEDISQALAAGTLFVGIVDGSIAAAGIFNDDFANSYDKVPWTIEASGNEVLCVHLFATHPNYWNQGVGRRTLKGIMEILKGRGVKTLRLDVLNHNKPAMRLYEAVGFRFICETELEYGLTNPHVAGKLFCMYEIEL